MQPLIQIIIYLLPILGVATFIIGLHVKSMQYVLAAFWIALISMLIQYQNAGGEILGTYFDYPHAFMYSLALGLLITCLYYLLFKTLVFKRKMLQTFATLLFASIIISAVVLLINLWMNALFIENKAPKTAVMQVITFTPPAYCTSRSIFYKVTATHQVAYLCPNYYGILPKVDQLNDVPSFIAQHLQHLSTPRDVEHSESSP